MPKIVAISDIHGRWNKLGQLPECDILVSAGDYSFRGEKHMVKDFHKWLGKQPSKHVISVQGNHELWVRDNFQEAKSLAESVCPNVHFIGDHGLVEIEGIKIYGSAITPFFHNWAWNVERGPDIAAEWAKIPDDVNVLVTHGPAEGILDIVPFQNGAPKELVGCKDLFDRIMKLEKLKVHICGHIHHSHGYQYFNEKQFYNVAICDEMYMPTNPITVIEL